MSARRDAVGAERGLSGLVLLSCALKNYWVSSPPSSLHFCVIVIVDGVVGHPSLPIPEDENVTSRHCVVYLLNFMQWAAP